jgi:hypothetical protein
LYVTAPIILVFLSDLVDDIQAAEGPCIRFVVGSAGAGKSVLFKNLFGLTYRDFIAKKNRRVLSRRPIPFIPEHLRETYIIRTVALVDSFLRTDVAAPVPRETLEWMLANGCCSWMFDGLDELYSGDPEFFDYLLEKLTRPDSQAQILICARDSLLSSNDRLMEFLNIRGRSATCPNAMWRIGLSAIILVGLAPALLVDLVKAKYGNLDRPPQSFRFGHGGRRFIFNIGDMDQSYLLLPNKAQTLAWNCDSSYN